MVASGLVSLAYFLQLYLLHLRYVDNLEYVERVVPIFLNRYRYQILAIGLLRDKIIYNNSLESYEPYEGYGYNADVYYNDLQTDVERVTIETMTNYRQILADMVEYIADFDSPNFCQTVIARSMDTLEKQLEEQGNIVLQRASNILDY